MNAGLLQTPRHNANDRLEGFCFIGLLAIFTGQLLIVKQKFLLSLILSFLLFSCAKQKSEEEAVPQLITDFAFAKACDIFLPNDVQYIDSTVRFVNFSDTGSKVTYRWHFGDGDSSALINPQHAYAKPGTYRVWLHTLYKGVLSDTVSKNLRIIAGQQAFKTNHAYTEGVDIEEAENGALLVLLSRQNTYADPLSYSLLKVDSVLKKIWLKPFSGSNVRASSIKKINAGEYVIAGNVTTGNVDQFSLSKISGNGDVVWVKYLNNLAGINNYVTPTTDGNLLTVGNTPVGNQRMVVVKCDGNGNELWRKTFDGTQSLPAVYGANNIIETADGYVFAALKAGVSDQETVLMKTDKNGNFLQQTTIPLLSGSTAFETGVAFSANTFMVYATNTQYAYFFGSNLSFIHYRKVAETGIRSGTAKNEKFFVAEGTNQYGYVKQLQSSGTADWSTIIGHRIVLGCGSYSSGATRYCRKALCTNEGDVVALSDGQNSSQGFNGSSVYLERFAANGQLK